MQNACSLAVSTAEHVIMPALGAQGAKNSGYRPDVPFYWGVSFYHAHLFFWSDCSSPFVLASVGALNGYAALMVSFSLFNTTQDIFLASLGLGLARS